MNENSYNEEPVLYCKRCLSLKIKNIPVGDVDYCDECGATEIGETDINTWNKMYEEKYGHPFIQKEKIVIPYWFR
jgi:hypothetical protein